MPLDPNSLIPAPEPDDLSPLSMSELRATREHLQEVEYGFSYARRVVQGRLDTVLAVLEHASRGDSDADTIGELPETLGRGIQGPGLPRPTRGLEPPAWADDLLTELDEALPLHAEARLSELDPTELADAASRVSTLERQLSEARSSLHGRIERVQAELILRYREGASVEDLLT